MLSSVTEDRFEISVREEVKVDDADAQSLIFRVGPVFSLKKECGTGIWVYFRDGDTLQGPALIDYKSWKKINKHVKRKWRKRTWALYMFFDRISSAVSRWDIRLL